MISITDYSDPAIHLTMKGTFIMSKKTKIIILVVVLAVAAVTISRCQIKASVNDQTIVDIDTAASDAK